MRVIRPLFLVGVLTWPIAFEEIRTHLEAAYHPGEARRR